MKKQTFLLVIFLILSFIFPASADRTANAWDCSSAHEFTDKLEVGTVVDFDCTIDTIGDEHIQAIPAIKGCYTSVFASIPVDATPAGHIPGSLVHVHGTVS